MGNDNLSGTQSSKVQKTTGVLTQKKSHIGI